MDFGERTKHNETRLMIKTLGQIRKILKSTYADAAGLFLANMGDLFLSDPNVESQDLNVLLSVFSLFFQLHAAQF